MVRPVYVLTFFLFCFAVFALYLAFRARAKVISQQAKIQWVHFQAERALSLINSEEPADILIGLQMLSVFDIASVRLRAFPRLIELKRNGNKHVAELAEYAIRVSQSSERRSNGSSDQLEPLRHSFHNASG